MRTLRALRADLHGRIEASMLGSRLGVRRGVGKRETTKSEEDSAWPRRPALQSHRASDPRRHSSCLHSRISDGTVLAQRSPVNCKRALGPLLRAVRDGAVRRVPNQLVVLPESSLA